MRATIGLMVLILGWSGAVSTVEAKDLEGRFGIGADSSLGLSRTGNPLRPDLSVPGLSAVYRVSKSFGLQLIGSLSVAGGDADATTAALSARGMWGFEFTTDAHLEAVFGASFFSRSVEEDPADLWFAFELGIRPEWFIADELSIHTQVGLVVGFDQDWENTDQGGVHMTFLGNADLLGNAGFTYWF